MADQPRRALGARPPVAAPCRGGLRRHDRPGLLRHHRPDAAADGAVRRRGVRHRGRPPDAHRPDGRPGRLAGAHAAALSGGQPQARPLRGRLPGGHHHLLAGAGGLCPGGHRHAPGRALGRPAGSRHVAGRRGAAGAVVVGHRRAHLDHRPTGHPGRTAAQIAGHPEPGGPGPCRRLADAHLAAALRPAHLAVQRQRQLTAATGRPRHPPGHRAGTLGRGDRTAGDGKPRGRPAGRQRTSPAAQCPAHARADRPPGHDPSHAHHRRAGRDDGPGTDATGRRGRLFAHSPLPRDDRRHCGLCPR